MAENIAVIRGDGVGAEVIDATLVVLDKISQKHNIDFKYTDVVAGGAAIDRFGNPLPDESLETLLKSDAILLGALGGPKWDSAPVRPEQALLAIRKNLNLYANLRPAKLYPSLNGICPVKNADGTDLIIVRELTGGIYYGKRGMTRMNTGLTAFDTESYGELEIERITRVAYELAQKRKKHLTSVDKANILQSSALWRKVVHEINGDYPDVTVDDLYVDNAAMQLIKQPQKFDVIVTSNMFGDILSDEASVLAGSMGLLPSASLNDTTLGLYEPVHGSAPDIAGLDVVNPSAAILSAAMMLRYSFAEYDAADSIENAVEKTLNTYRTADVQQNSKTTVKCSEFAKIVADNI